MLLKTLIVLLLGLPQQPDAMAMFLSDAPAAWKKYEAALAEAEASIQLADSLNGKAVYSASVVVKRLGQSQLYSIHHVTAPEGDPRRGTEELYCANEDYWFSLSRSREPGARSEAQWVLTQAGKSDNRMPPLFDLRLQTGFALSGQAVGMAPGELLSELVDCPTFRATKAEFVEQGGRQLVRVDFENNHEISAQPGQVGLLVQGGWMVLDPSQYWCVINYEIRRGSPQDTALVVGEYEYKDVGGLPVPDRVHYQQDGYESIRVMSLKTGADKPDASSFRLSAFGLPELNSLAQQEIPSKSRLWIWCAVVGLLMVVVLIALLRNQHQRNSRITAG